MSSLLTTERLKSFSDSVLLVAITILAYNLVPPSVVNGQVNPDEMRDFFYNLYGLISSFMVISVFWIFSMYFFDYLKYPTEIITLILITFFVLILITPITTVAELQYRNWEAVALLSLLQVFNSMMLMLLWWLLGKNKNLQIKEIDNGTKKKMYIRLTIIPSLYVISIGLSFFNFNLAVIFPVFMIPSLILVAKVHKRRHGSKE
ncbi:MAG: TMEM175 family protein [Nitrososphaeraceae archaeon]|nr:TMEM175 family protein [Nitrososphaeraceae archaeon]MDW0333030.1 TMEM175 family protein [Nitrososphaeraceae archaeon]